MRSAHAEVEQLVADWARTIRNAPAAVLRPVTGLAEDGLRPGWPALAGGSRRRLAPEEEDLPAQFVHLDDLAGRASTWCGASGLDGTCNVSPDGWIAGPRLRALAGSKLRRAAAGVGHPLDRPLALAVPAWPIPPGAAAVHDAGLAGGQRPAEGGRLAAQVSPTSRPSSPAPRTAGGSCCTPKRAQELALALAGVVSVAGVATAVLLIRRRAGRGARSSRSRSRSLLTESAKARAGRSGAKDAPEPGNRSCGACLQMQLPGVRGSRAGLLSRWGEPGGRRRPDGLAVADQGEVDGVADLALARGISVLMSCTGTSSTATTMSPSARRPRPRRPGVHATT